MSRLKQGVRRCWSAPEARSSEPFAGALLGATRTNSNPRSLISSRAAGVTMVRVVTSTRRVPVGRPAMSRTLST
ncbi:MAG: hypothetical protein R3B96_09505 [Pirellulaceae bacterium]